MTTKRILMTDAQRLAGIRKAMRSALNSVRVADAFDPGRFRAVADMIETHLDGAERDFAAMRSGGLTAVEVEV
jgi:hypothetical protein